MTSSPRLSRSAYRMFSLITFSITFGLWLGSGVTTWAVFTAHPGAYYPSGTLSVFLPAIIGTLVSIALVLAKPALVGRRGERP